MKNKKTVLLSIIIIAVLALGGVLLYKHRSRQVKPVAPVSTANEDQIDLTPATQDDQKRADQSKEQRANQEQQKPTTSNTQTSVTPIIISASQTSVKGFIPTVYESGGTCTATFTQGSQTVTKQSAANKGATTTDCTPISLSRSDFPAAGEWTVVLSYKSSTAAGASASQKVTVN